MIGSTLISSSGGVGGLIGSNKIVPVCGSERGLVRVSLTGLAASFGLYLFLRASKSTGSSKSGCLLMRLLSTGGDLRLSTSNSTGSAKLSTSKSASAFVSKSESVSVSVLPDCGLTLFLTGSALATSTFLGGLHFTRSARYCSYFGGAGFGLGWPTRTHCPLQSFHCF